jgi:hypothetical protein
MSTVTLDLPPLSEVLPSVINGYAFRVVPVGHELIDEATGETVTVTDESVMIHKGTLYMTEATIDWLKTRLELKERLDADRT